MLWLKNKLDNNLRHALKNNYYKKYRVLIYCRNLKNNIEKKIVSYKGNIIHSLTFCNVICAYVTPRAIDHLIEFPEVQWITKDSYCFICGSSVEASNNVRFSQKMKLTGKGIGIALIDTGVYPHHDLINPYNRIKTFFDIINGYKFPYDDNGHGTFISGVLCGNGGLSKGIYKGMAEGAYLHCFKAFNSNGKGFVSDVLFAMESVINVAKDHNIRIMCLPLELYNNDFFIIDCFSKLFDMAISNNIITIVPSGSNGNVEGSMEGISCLSNCITVGGMDTTSKIKGYEFSSCGPFQRNTKPDVAAACVDVCSLNTNKKYISERNSMKIYPPSLEDPYCTYSGTSIAAAYVSSLCALILENDPSLSFKDVKALLKVSCTLLDLPKWQQGEGVIEVSKIFKI